MTRTAGGSVGERIAEAWAQEILLHDGYSRELADLAARIDAAIAVLTQERDEQAVLIKTLLDILARAAEVQKRPCVCCGGRGTIEVSHCTCGGHEIGGGIHDPSCGTVCCPDCERDVTSLKG